MFELSIFQHWFRSWLGAGQSTSHCLNQWWLDYWCIYESLNLNELTHFHTCYNVRSNYLSTSPFPKSVWIIGEVRAWMSHYMRFKITDFLRGPWGHGYVIFKWILVIDGRGISCEIALIYRIAGAWIDTNDTCSIVAKITLKVTQELVLSTI